MSDKPKNVTMITIQMRVDGVLREAIFIRKEKVDDLLAEDGTMGRFLRDLRDGPGFRTWTQ